MIIKKTEAESFAQPGITGRKYHIDEFIKERTWVYGELDGEHGERESGETPRIYFVVKGKGSVEIDGQKSEVEEGDLVIIPPKSKYNYWSSDGLLKFILFMERH
ncbi:MAG: cupin domain-containing protein [Candidatus Dojkabacteria bacterium]|nr:cupin domain-containing protein [Candidatus Dojkabacteria bacterium]